MWLDSYNTNSIEALIAWSFYSQGSSEDKQISATPFFSHAFGVLKSDKTQFNTEEEKGEHLAHLLRQRRCLLVLDGLEPLQHAGRGMRGELKDRAIRQLLKSLAGEYNSLCIITSRIAVHELSNRAHVISHDLQNLAPEDGVSLLKSWEVHGSAIELEKAVHEYGCHALALHLLGNALHTYLDGDVRKRDTLDELLGDYDAIERHAFKVMQAYQRWLVDEAGNPTAELQLLYLLGLFDHPIETEVLEVLWQAQIPGLTVLPQTFWQKLLGKRHNISIEEHKRWKIAIRDLREKHHLLSSHEGRSDLLDCHPLIREYFGKQLQTNQPEVWQQAHERLYDYYKALPEKEFPDTLEEMQPLFSAVAHGCAAGLHQQVDEEVYWPRIQREASYYCIRKLCAFSHDLATVAHFFTIPWHTLAAGLPETYKAGMLHLASYDLRAMGRLREALEPMQATIEILVKQKDVMNAAINVDNFCQLHLILGNVAEGILACRLSIDYADQSGVSFISISNRTTYADALHQAGELQAAFDQLRKAEQLQQKHQPKYPFLYSLGGFRYCDLLLSQGNTTEVMERAEQILEWMEKDKNTPILTIAIEQLTLGRAHLQQVFEEIPNCSLSAAEWWLEQAVAGFRAAGTMQYLPLGLLARAALHRATGDFVRALADLQEVFDIAEPSGMRLHLTDYHLEMARLLLAEMETPPSLPLSGEKQEVMFGLAPSLTRESGGWVTTKEHIEKAAKLIAETGYHRRDPELAQLKQALQNA